MKYVSKEHRNLGNITGADLIVRTGYQIGKSPVLPIMATQLGANDVILALIVSISTISGMILKPLIGFLSDNLGRKIWLLIGTLLFAGVPFLYEFIQTPNQLIGLRIFHGLSTAIYGPVTLAYVAEIRFYKFGQNFGIFSLARNSSYIIGPLIGGWLLLSYEPTQIYTIIGCISILAFIPIAFLNQQNPSDPEKINTTTLNSTTIPSKKNLISNTLLQPPPPHTDILNTEYLKSLLSKFKRSSNELKNKSIWIAGSAESLGLMSTYATKIFVPLNIIVTGNNVFAAATFIAIQHGTQLLISVTAGKLWDKIGHVYGIYLGIILLGVGINLIPLIEYSIISIPITSTIIGIGMGFMQPSASAYISTNVNKNSLGFSIGLSGTLKNMSKILGPIFLGTLIISFGFTNSLHILGTATILGIFLIMVIVKFPR